MQIFLTLCADCFSIVKTFIYLDFSESPGVQSKACSLSPKHWIRVSAALFLALILAIPAWAEDAPKVAAPKAGAAKAAPVEAKKDLTPKPEETVFFTVSAGGHQVLCRSNALGTCKACLGRAGEGWLPYADPKLDGDDLAAATTRDGSRLALITNRGGSVNLWLVSPDGKVFERLTDDEAGIMPAADARDQSLAFSPDGKMLAFIKRGDVWIMNLADREPRTLSSAGGAMALAWSSDSKWVAAVLGKSIHKLGATGDMDRMVAAEACDQPSLAWNPDSKSDEIFFLGRGVSKVNGARHIDLVAPSSVVPNSLAVQASAKGVALLAPSASGQPEIYFAPLGGKGTAQVTQGGASAVWASLTGKQLYFLRESVLWRCETDGSKAHPLGAVPVSHVSLGILPPLKGACP